MTHFACVVKLTTAHTASCHVMEYNDIDPRLINRANIVCHY